MTQNGLIFRAEMWILVSMLIVGLVGAVGKLLAMTLDAIREEKKGEEFDKHRRGL